MKNNYNIIINFIIIYTFISNTFLRYNNNYTVTNGMHEIDKKTMKF